MPNLERGLYQPAYSEDRKSIKFDVCANCEGLIVPGMVFHRAIYKRSGVSELGPTGLYAEKHHKDCQLDWYQAEQPNIATTLGKLRSGTRFLANNKPKGPDVPLVVKFSDEDLGDLSYVLPSDIQRILRCNGSQTVENAMKAIKMILALRVTEIVDAIGDKYKAKKLDNSLNIHDLADLS